MIIHCKIGTLAGTYMRVKYLHRVLRQGEIIQGFETAGYLPYNKGKLLRSLHYSQWKYYQVDKIEERGKDGYFYFLSKWA